MRIELKLVNGKWEMESGKWAVENEVVGRSFRSGLLVLREFGSSEEEFSGIWD